MQTLDTTISNVALPTIQGNLGASIDEATWVITSYTIAAIIVIPLTPWLQNRFGRKNYFCASIVGFTLASVACGLSDSLTMLVIARVVQGAFGGGLLATAQAILRDAFPPKQLAASQGIFALGAIMGAALGPTLGGYLVDNSTWNWCFDINVLAGMLATVCIVSLGTFVWWELRIDLPIVDLHAVHRAMTGRIDPRWLLGTGLLLMGVGNLLQAQVTTTESDFWMFAPALIIVGVAGSMLFVPISVAVLGATTLSDGPKAGAMVNLATQLGGSMAVALLDVVVDRRMTFHSEVLDGNATLASPAVAQYVAHGGSLRSLAGLVDTQALVLAYADATYVMMLIALVCVPLVFLMRRRKAGVARPIAVEMA